MICFREVTYQQCFEDWFFHRDCICGQCRSSFLVLESKFMMDELSVYGLYHYEESLENLLFQYKESRDIALAPIFFNRYVKWVKHHFAGYTLIGMPSSQDKIEERGFHHLQCMVKEIDLPYLDLFEKDAHYKQSLQDAITRRKISKHIHLKQGVTIPNTPLLLIDDVCTTGSTLSCAYQLLKKHKLPIEALVLCVHEQFMKEHQTKTGYQNKRNRRKG